MDLPWAGAVTLRACVLVCALRSRLCVTKFSALMEQDAKANKCRKNLLVVTLGGTCPFPATGTPVPKSCIPLVASKLRMEP